MTNTINSSDVEAGTGEVLLDGKRHTSADGSAVVIPAGVEHNVVNTSRVNRCGYTPSIVRRSMLTALFIIQRKTLNQTGTDDVLDVRNRMDR